MSTDDINAPDIDDSSETSALREKIADPTYLPSVAEVQRAFPAQDDQYGINSDFKIFMGREKRYQLITQEFIDGIADHLQGTIQELPTDKKVTILEVGAGNGSLSHHLSNRLNGIGLEDRVQTIATDDKSWEHEDTPRVKPGFTGEVLQLNAEGAISQKADENTIVIASWMPPGVDWTNAMREQGVKEYILIGDEDATGTMDAWGFGDHEGYIDERINDQIEGNISNSDDSPRNAGRASITSFKRV